MTDSSETRYVGFPGLLSPPYVALTNDVLSDPDFQFDLATALGRVAKSRREIPDWVADVFYHFNGTITWEDGREYPIHDVDWELAWNDAGTFRWISNFLKLPLNPWKQKAQRRVLARMRLIALALAIDPPDAKGHTVHLAFPTERDLIWPSYNKFGRRGVWPRITNFSDAVYLADLIIRDRKRLHKIVNGFGSSRLWSTAKKRLSRRIENSTSAQGI